MRGRKCVTNIILKAYWIQLLGDAMKRLNPRRRLACLMPNQRTAISTSFAKATDTAIAIAIASRIVAGSVLKVLMRSTIAPLPAPLTVSRWKGRSNNIPDY